MFRFKYQFIWRKFSPRNFVFNIFDFKSFPPKFSQNNVAFLSNFYGCELSLIGKLFSFLLSFLSGDNEQCNHAFDYNNLTASMLFERIGFVLMILKLVLHHKVSERIHFMLFECNISTMLQQTITERTSNPIILKRTITYNMTLRGK